MREIANAAEVEGFTAALAERVREWVRDHRDASGRWALIGIKSRGDVLARRLAARLGEVEGLKERVGSLDVTLYRDDLSEVAAQPVVRTTEVNFAIDGVDVVLVDDVLMTGRSVRAALQSLMDMGRPRRVWLAVLVDRGGRELPIRPDAAGLYLTRDPRGVKPGDHVQVLLDEVDGRDAVVAGGR